MAEIVTKLELGGAQRHVLAVIKGLPKEKYEFTLLTSSGVLNNEAQAISGINLCLVKNLRREISPLNDLIALFQIWRYLRNNKVDIVHTHSSKAGILGRIAARLAGVNRIIHTIHGWSFNDYQNILVKSFFIYLERVTARFTSKIIAVSNYDIAIGLKNKIGHESQYFLIRYGIDAESFCKNIQKDNYIRQSFKINEQAPIVGMAACFKPQKAHSVFLKVARHVLKEIPDAHFIFAGDGELRGRIERQAAFFKEKENFHFPGWVQDMASFYQTVNVLVLTSLWEGLPLSLIEAFACQKPVVATDICGNKEIVHDGVNGFLVKPNDYRAFAQRIISLIKDKKKAQEMGIMASKILSLDLQESVMLSNIDALYQITVSNLRG